MSAGTAGRTLTKEQFIALDALAEPGSYFSGGVRDNTLADLVSLGFMAEGTITPAGLDRLEPYRVKRAVFMAAGLGARLKPATLTTPKPLLQVKGCRMIETTLDAVVAAGIGEIYIVRGYLAEHFDALLEKYPGLRFIENPDYDSANNIMSAYYAREYLRNAYIFDADLVLMNPGLVTRYQYSSNYLGIPVERTDDWCFTGTVDRIGSMVLGGTSCHKCVGVSYWTGEDGKRLAADIVRKIAQPRGREAYWDDVPLNDFREHYHVGIRPCSDSDIVEIDTFEEWRSSME